MAGRRVQTHGRQKWRHGVASCGVKCRPASGGAAVAPAISPTGAGGAAADVAVSRQRRHFHGVGRAAGRQLRSDHVNEKQ